MQIEDENMIIDDSFFKGEILDAEYEISYDDIKNHYNEFISSKKSVFESVIKTSQNSFNFKEGLNIFTLISE